MPPLFVPANVPEGGYAAYGVDGIGMDPNGYPSNEDATFVDSGFPGCPGREPKPAPAPSEYTNGVVTPHAAFLGLRWAPEQAVANLERLRRDFPEMHGNWGFRDSVNVDTGAAGRPSGEATPAGHRDGGVRRVASAVHDHRYAASGPPAWDARR